MKTKFFLFLALGFTFYFQSCTDDSPVTPDVKGPSYIINYGHAIAAIKEVFQYSTTGKDTVF